MDERQISTPESRFRVAVEMADFGVEMMRQNLRRADPDASDEEIRARLRAWLRRRPFDGPGRIGQAQQP